MRFLLSEVERLLRYTCLYTKRDGRSYLRRLFSKAYADSQLLENGKVRKWSSRVEIKTIVSRKAQRQCWVHACRIVFLAEVKGKQQDFGNSKNKLWAPDS
ncbi:hypothetical protein MRX96_009810 [Rhipicephalus microplus]